MAPRSRCFVSVPAQGYVVDTRRRSRFGHHFCGEHDIAGAWCPNCDKPMLRLLSLDTSDPRLGLASLGAPLVHLLFCWTCNLAQDATSYRLRNGGGVELLRHRRGGVETDFPYADYPRAFPGRSFELVPVTPAEQALLDTLNAGEWRADDLPPDAQHLGTPRHQVGGRPLLLQGPPDAPCPECGAPMTFVACCGDETADGGSFAGNAFVQVVFVLCVRDRIVTSFQRCD